MYPVHVEVLIFGVRVGHVVLFDEMQTKIGKLVPSGGNRNGNDQKIGKNAGYRIFMGI